MEHICVLAYRPEDGIDLVKWCHKYDPAALVVKRTTSTVFTTHVTYHIFAVVYRLNGDQLMGANFDGCYIVNKDGACYDEAYVKFMNILEQRREHMRIPADLFYKYFNGYFGR